MCCGDKDGSYFGDDEDDGERGVDAGDVVMGDDDFYGDGSGNVDDNDDGDDIGGDCFLDDGVRDDVGDIGGDCIGDDGVRDDVGDDIGGDSIGDDRASASQSNDANVSNYAIMARGYACYVIYHENLN